MHSWPTLAPATSSAKGTKKLKPNAGFLAARNYTQSPNEGDACSPVRHVHTDFRTPALRFMLAQPCRMVASSESTPLMLLPRW